MMALLNALATSGKRANWTPSEDWSFLRIPSFTAKIEVLDENEGLLGTFALREKSVSRTKKNQNYPALDLLNLAGSTGLYHSLKGNPRIRRLDAAISIGGLACPQRLV